MEIKGKIIANLGIQTGTSKAGKSWSKATIVVEYGEGQYPKRVALDNLKQAEEFAKLPIGAEGEFHFEVESREYNGRWFTSVNCWKWVMAQTTQESTQPIQQPPIQTPHDTKSEDLPF